VTVLVVPGAFTAPDAFDAFATTLTDGLGPAVGPVHVVTLPARAARLPQLHRGGLRAADRLLDEQLERAATDSGPVVLAGHSLGGLLSLRAARRGHVDALVLLMPVPPGGLVRDLLAMARHDPLSAATFASLAVTTWPVRTLPLRPPRGLFTDGASPEVRDRSRAWRVDESWLVLAQLALGSREPVAPLAVPTLVVAGRDDTLVPAAAVRRLAGELRADLRELPVAHNFNEEPAGDVVGAEVLTWLAARGIGADHPTHHPTHHPMDHPRTRTP